jgi:hypothetical protein
MKNVLYISILGMSEPLGKSQVLEYLIDLSKKFNIYLYSFEKDLDSSVIKSLESQMNDHDINWLYQRYSNKHGIFSTIKQIISSFLELRKIVKNSNIKVIHARSMIPVVIALILKLEFGVRVIFDIRGFQIDEKAEVGRFKKESMFYKILKFIEKKAYQTSDSIVTLTYASIDIISNHTNKEKITVIPTCANKKVFKKLSQVEKEKFKRELGYSKDDKIILHAGAVSNWYDFDNELLLISQLMKDDINLNYLILNKSEHKFIWTKVEEYCIDKSRLKVMETDFYTMYKYLNVVDASMFIIKPTFSKTASAPTKFAENLACGLFSITNNGIGDMNKFFQEYKTLGYSFDLKDLKNNLEHISKNILSQMLDEKNLDEYDFVYEKFLSKEMAIEKYTTIYEQLLKD